MPLARLHRLAPIAALAFATGCASGAPPRVAAPAPAADLAAALSGFIWPLPLETASGLASPYGVRSRRHHDGLDLRARHGDPVFAARDGRVRFSGTLRGYGRTVVLEHAGGVTTLYAHASELYVLAGQTVAQGQVIAAVGATGNATGPHLHFEVAWSGAPIDPVPLLPRLDARRSAR